MAEQRHILPRMDFVRVLIVEDFKPFRDFIWLSLQQRTEFKIVGEAADGLEAVLKAADLQPDLILLDIGLPKVNGFEAAKQIRELAPSARLLFISQESSPAVVEESFRLGGYGYVLKLRAQSDLLTAIEAVLAGKRFVSHGLESGRVESAYYRHEVQFYSDDSVFLECSGRFIADALNARNAAIVVVTRPHREALVQRLKGEGVDIEGAIRRRTCVSIDATEVLPQIVINGLPDPLVAFKMFWGFIESVVKAAKADPPRVAILGECASLLHAEGNLNAAISLEKIGEELSKIRSINSLDILCPYALSDFPGGKNDPSFSMICAEHTAACSR